MSHSKKDEIQVDHNHDGVDRRGFLKCMAWAGTGTICLMSGGVLKSYSLSRLAELDPSQMKGELSFAQISDSHMGFNKAANPDVVATLKAAVAKINALPTPPEFLLHTGDISHLAKPEEFDTVDQILKGAVAKDVFFVPGEHDFVGDDGQQYRERYAKGSKGAGWYSFDKKGVHFVGLVNVQNLKAGGLGSLGHDQLEWLEDDVKSLGSSTPGHRLRPHSALVDLSRLGLGHGRQRAGAFIFEALRLGHRAQRPHPPDHAKSGRQRNLSHRRVHRVPSARAGQGRFTGHDESSGRTTAQLAWRDR